MPVDLKEHYCERIGKKVLVEIRGKRFISTCEYYHADRNPYSMRFNRICSADFPKNKRCLIERLIIDERLKLIRNKSSF